MAVPAPTTHLRLSRSAAGSSLPDAQAPDVGRVVVVAPHPDDETLGAGGTIHDLTRLGFSVTVVVVTDVAASHEDVPDLAAIRREEACRASIALGVAAPPHFLDFPDGQVANVRETLASSLRALIEGCVLVIGPRSGDGHPDHEATAEAVIEATTGIPEARRPDLWRYAIWAWEWDGIAPEDLVGARVWPVTAEGRRRRTAAIAAYKSQITDLRGDAIVAAAMVASVEQADEVFWC